VFQDFPWLFLPLRNTRTTVQCSIRVSMYRCFAVHTRPVMAARVHRRRISSGSSRYLSLQGFHEVTHGQQQQQQQQQPPPLQQQESLDPQQAPEAATGAARLRSFIEVQGVMEV
jgi:hypothetical protein